MSEIALTEFERLVVDSENTVGTAVLFLLTWIAVCDGQIDKQEASKLAEIAANTRHGHDTGPLLTLARKKDAEALQLACEIVQMGFSGERRLLFMELAIGVAVADRRLLTTENYVIRLLADLLHVSPRELDGLFVAQTGRPMPEPSDPSMARTWRANGGAHDEQGRPSSTSFSGDPRLLSAYAVLGLEYGASREEVRLAYRRLAQIHHPDRFSSLGAESVATATGTFKRIKEAYDYLVANA